MHSAPSVSYPVGRSRLLGLLLFAVWLGGVAAAGALASAPGALWRSALVAATAVLAGLAAGRWWWRSAQGQLQSDGLRWAWLPHTGAGAQPLGMLTVHLDVQRALLVRGEQPGAAPLWLWLEQGAAPGRWDDLRRAVYSPASPPAVGVLP